ncbi:beta-N-acetylhexosaminidase [Geomicrobium halophilum]|uniref:beta-N-acetylhexosaminidase n=1 Tax=Geomicrobium halophilum TaxID=549000 RepID=A0A841PRV3_9BACL|nr:glycoside hydrolase family 3 protein [Geomicrobium halophilum]MBB6450534.1 beta-N-acetylhexosaminidase [Geomicrobium halophilum]
MRQPVKKSTFFLLLGVLSFSPHSHSQAEGSVQDFILYENIEQADVQPGESTTLQGMNIYEDGHFTFVDEDIMWSSTNEDVARVDQDGHITWTGRPGKTYIEASNGNHEDRIVLQNGERTKIIKQTDDRHKLIDNAIAGMTIEEMVGQMLMPDFRTWGKENVTEMPPGIEQLIKNYHLGGVIFFGENIKTPAQATELIADYQAASEKYAMLTTIDQEGGLVNRLQAGTSMPGNMALGAGNDLGMSSKVGRVIGAELESLGFNMNMAPSMDVNNNPDNPVIGIRSFGEDPSLVANHGVAFMEGMQESGVAVTAKHFPGHGDTDIDSHVGSPKISHDRNRLYNVELYPFQSVMDHDVDAIMTAHVTLPEIDSSTFEGTESLIPATLSDKVITGLMREEMGYDGVIFTDSLKMNAISSHHPPVDAAIHAVQAGSDIVLMPVDVEEVAEGMINAVHQDVISEERMKESVARILELKLKRGIVKEEHPLPSEEKVAQAEDTLASEEHLEIERQAAKQGITVVKNENQTLPLNLREDELVVVIGNELIDGLSSAITAHHPNVETMALPENGQLNGIQWEKICQASHVIVGTYTSDYESRQSNHPQMEIVRRIQADIEGPLITVGIRNPYDIMAYANTDVYLAQYGFARANFEATASILFGEIDSVGRLPVTIPSLEGGVLYKEGHGLSNRE